MVNTSQQIGGSIGTTLLSTLAVSATTEYLAGRTPAPDALADALTELAEYFEEAGWDDFALRTHHEVLEFRRELGDPAKLRAVLTSLRDNLKRQERYEEALAVAQEELPLALRLAVPGERSTGIANTARYWITDFLGIAEAYQGIG